MSATPYRYTAELANEIEAKWQDRWESQKTFSWPNPSKLDADDDTFFLLDMFPYPSGKGLHVGHPLGYIATDTLARFARMSNKSVVYTMGYDAFGLPAEQYAVQTGQHPQITTEENIANMSRQLRRLGMSHDMDRTLATTDPQFVRWTQWIFLQIYNAWYDREAERARPIGELLAGYEDGSIPTPTAQPWSELNSQERRDAVDSRRLAYVDFAPVNWCPGLGTVLANEEVTAEGRSERGNFPVFKRQMRQWMMRITEYAERLSADLDKVDWPEKVRLMQRNWIGKSVGATVKFTAHHAQGDSELAVFTTRPDTIFGATFVVVAPDHPLLELENLPDGGAGLTQYRHEIARVTDKNRGDQRAKTGVFTGIYATNPVTGEKVKVFAADYVSSDYGTGAIMAVPAHDQRDFEFAKAYDLPVRPTLAADADFDWESAWVGDGEVINSANASLDINGLPVDQAKERVISWLEDNALGEKTTSYRLRDWGFSRQRYWGEPFPIVYDEQGNAHALPEQMLPVGLPDLPDFSPRTYDPNDSESEPEAPLGRLDDWVNIELDLGSGPKIYKRETNTMPNWAGSCWYALRYLDPHNDKIFIDPEVEKYWIGPNAQKPAGGADLYVGGVEHAVLHLLYSRFWHKVLHDLGWLSSSEPFHKLFNQGYVQAYAYTDSRGQYVPAEEVQQVEVDGKTSYRYAGQEVNREYGKMGKSLKNIVTPDEISQQYGADTFRLYEMSMGPLELDRPWETRAVVGSQRFLQRLWRNIIDEETGALVVEDSEPDLETARLLARTIEGVRSDFEQMHINTAIAKLIVLNNHLTGKPVARSVASALVLMVAPLAPHIAEELWERLGNEKSLAYEAFPTVTDESLLVDDTVTAIVQVRGKLRDRLQVSADISAQELEQLALASEKVAQLLSGPPRKVIVREPNLVNIVP